MPVAARSLPSVSLSRSRPVAACSPSFVRRYSGNVLLSTSAPEVEVAFGELLAELLRLPERRALERGDHRERRAAIVQQLLDRLGALDEPCVHRLEVQEELGDVLEELTPEDAVGHLVERVGSPR